MADIRNPTGPVPLPLQRQITTTAKYYPPAVYGFGSSVGNDVPALLSFYKSLALTADPAASGFIPFSAVPSQGRNTKLFAVGILPPSMDIDESQLLDRSAVVPNLTGDAVTDDQLQALEQAQAQDLIVPRQMSPEGEALIAKFEGNRLAAYRDSAGVLTIGIGHTGSDVTPGLVWTQSQVDTAFKQDISKFEQVVSSTVKVPVTQGQYDAMVSLAYNIGGGAFANSTLLAKLNAGDYAGASAEFAAFNKITPKGSNQKVISADLVRRRGIEQQVFDRQDLVPGSPTPVGDDADSAVFAGYGSNNANTFRQDLARQVDLKQVDLLATQSSYLKTISSALQSMQNTPPLRLLVNPSSFSVRSQKIVSDGNWGRNGPIIEFWGDDQDKISGSGSVAAFYALDAFPELGRGGPGLTRSARNMSMAWQNFQSLYLLYRNNGGMFLSDMSREERDALLTVVGSVYIFYDNILYIGSFDSFNVNEADTKPFSIDYSFEFTVRAAFLLEYASDFSYGGSPVFKDSTLGNGLPTRSDATTGRNLTDIAATGSTVVNSNSAQGTIDAAADALLGGVF